MWLRCKLRIGILKYADNDDTQFLLSTYSTKLVPSTLHFFVSLIFMATRMRKVYYYLQDVEWWEETEVNTGSIPSEPTFSVSFFFILKNLLLTTVPN